MMSLTCVDVFLFGFVKKIHKYKKAINKREIDTFIVV